MKKTNDIFAPRRRRVLFIMDKCSRTNKKCLESMLMISKEFKFAYDIDYERFDPLQDEWQYNPDMQQLAIDEYAEILNALPDGEEYDFIIAEGLAAYFWLRSPYNGRLLVLNPMLSPDKEIASDISSNMRPVYTAHAMAHTPREWFVACMLSDNNAVKYKECSECFGKEKTVWTKTSIFNAADFFIRDGLFGIMMNMMVSPKFTFDAAIAEMYNDYKWDNDLSYCNVLKNNQIAYYYNVSDAGMMSSINNNVGNIIIRNNNTTNIKGPYRIIYENNKPVLFERPVLWDDTCGDKILNNL